jgi:c-di-GMP-binding flagellar brake protein YcgR
MITEKRHTTRHQYFYSRIYDETTHNQTGRLVDISAGGIRLLSDEPIKTDVNFQLRMVLPRSIEGKKSITFDAKSIWCEKTTDSDLYDAGFKLLHISPENEEIIDRLIKEC